MLGGVRGTHQTDLRSSARQLSTHGQARPALLQYRVRQRVVTASRRLRRCGWRTPTVPGSTADVACGWNNLPGGRIAELVVDSDGTVEKDPSRSRAFARKAIADSVTRDTVDGLAT